MRARYDVALVIDGDFHLLALLVCPAPPYSVLIFLEVRHLGKAPSLCPLLRLAFGKAICTLQRRRLVIAGGATGSAWSRGVSRSGSRRLRHRRGEPDDQRQQRRRRDCYSH